MNKEYTSLGLMSGTYGEREDASVILSDGNGKYKIIKDKNFQYDKHIYLDIHNLKEKIHKLEDLQKFNSELKNIERKITLFHDKVIGELSNKKIEIVGFHGQTIYHNAKEKISYQLGDGKLLSQLSKKDIPVDNVLKELIKNYKFYFSKINNKESLSKEYHQNLYGIDSCSFILNGKTHKGKVIEVIESGQIKVKINSKGIGKYNSGDIKIII